LGVQQIPLLVLTHDHADHVLGLPGVLADRSVGAVLVSPLAEPVEQADQVSEWTADLPVVVAAPGQSGDINDVHWEVLWPERIIRGEGSDPNNASVVLLVQTQGVRLLLTGDIEPAAQHALALASDDLAADVIKVPHHGSRYQDQLFWQEVHPRVALVSVGEGNTYGHPDPGLLAGLSDAGLLVARTDTQGTVVVVNDNGLRLVTQR
jgi:competence protein ComEC